MKQGGDYYIGGYTLMTNNPQWWDSTITVFNKFVDPITNIVRWYKTVLLNCFWKRTVEKMTVGNTIIETDTVICRIPENANFRLKYDWVKIPNDQMNNYFTLGIGDIIINGSIDDEINEYASGTRSTDILKKYADLGVMTIESVRINTKSGIVFNRHYLAKGV